MTPYNADAPNTPAIQYPGARSACWHSDLFVSQPLYPLVLSAIGDRHFKWPSVTSPPRSASLLLRDVLCGVHSTLRARRARRITGDLTIRGVTKQVVLDALYEGTGKAPWGGERAGFSASTSIDRREFGLQWNKAL